MVKLRHFDNTGTARFVTFNCYRNESGLESESAKSVLLSYLCEAREAYGILIYGYVFMSNHVHLVLHPPDGIKLGPVIGEIKSKTGRDLLSKVTAPEGSRRVFWQKRCYDHNCRTPKAVIEKINYCHTDPVRSGFVSEPGLWKWSSYNWYHGRGEVVLEIDRMEPGKSRVLC